ncbi:hypothetical protein FACS189413_12350 [Bacteroidia bacterium]|nr:hypothetical protein FACS189413_12350 [Bacteroidia bacterium]
MNNEKKQAVIIGAGPAGLTAAYQLLKEMPDVNVTIFEATDRIGGISTTIEYHGNRIDIGGHRFFSKNKQVNDFWENLLPVQGKPSKDDLLLGTQKDFKENGPDPEKTDIVMLIRERVSRIFYRRKFFDYPISIKSSTFVNMGLWNTIKAGTSYLYSSVKKRKENSLEDFYINRFGKQLYRMFFEDYTEKVWGIHPSKLSPSWGAQRVKSLSILNILKEAFLKIIKPRYESKQTSLIERFLYPKLGPGQLWSVVAEDVEKAGGKIHRNATVIKIQEENKTVRSVTVERDGKSETYPVDYLFSTMSVKDLVQAIETNVPKDVLQIASQLPYRDFITIGVLVKKLKLKNQTKIPTVKNIVPDCWIYIQERDVQIGRLQIFNNWSPYMVKDFQNTVWVGLEYFCNEGDKMWNMPQEDFIEFAISELVKIKIIDKEDVLDANQVKIQKAYPAYFGVYSEFDKVQNYLDAFENLYCLGRNGQHKYNNMDHSMLTAMEAIEVVKNHNKNKNSIWNVNTEEEYHESK